MSSPDVPNSIMARLPPNLASLFTQALKSYQLSSATFRVLCSLPPSSTAEKLVPQPPPVPPKSVLILDSSFNPPTLAHQRMALSALSDNVPAEAQISRKSRILLLLAINNADKAPKPAAFPQRLAMMYIFAQDLLSAAAGQKSACGGVDIAVTTEPYFHAKAAAITADAFFRGTPSPSSSSPSSLSSGPGAEGEAGVPEQIFLTGFDTLIRIFDPKYYPAGSMAAVLDPFFAHARLRVTMRPDAEWGDAADQRRYLAELKEGGLESVGGRTAWVERIEMREGRGEGEEVVSSTKVRGAVLRKDWDALRALVSEGVAGWIRDEGLYAEGGA
ncbi:Nucleotidylyl transferase [Hypoxylon fuscum]|nr:Nucleotidylyl transferase [Hypoxylon fuscum]